MSDKYQDQKKDEILQQVYDLLEQYKWGGMAKSTVIKLRFKGEFWLMPPEVTTKNDKSLT